MTPHWLRAGLSPAKASETRRRPGLAARHVYLVIVEHLSDTHWAALAAMQLGLELRQKEDAESRCATTSCIHRMFVDARRVEVCKGPISQRFPVLTQPKARPVSAAK